MSKKKEKLSAVEKELEYLIRKYRNPFSTTAPINEYCENIKKKACEDCDDCSYINFKDGKQYLPSGLHQFIDAVVMVGPLYADHAELCDKKVQGVFTG